MIRQPRFARFVLPLLLSLCQPSFAAELRAVAEARRQELLLEDSPVACGEVGCTARKASAWWRCRCRPGFWSPASAR